MAALSSTVGVLHGVQHQGVLLHAARRLSCLVRAEPVVGEAGVRGAVRQAVLKQVHLDPLHLCQLVVQTRILSQHLAGQAVTLPGLLGRVHEAVVLCRLLIEAERSGRHHEHLISGLPHPPAGTCHGGALKGGRGSQVGEQRHAGVVLVEVGEQVIGDAAELKFAACVRHVLVHQHPGGGHTGGSGDSEGTGGQGANNRGQLGCANIVGGKWLADDSQATCGLAT
mmetsp:Transcript_25245/g.54867  ORF Transcript_25245/g.54867 Transcript_25245/m.54867 type:complete len:225 (+) Transcript_25245:1541-2215(+)